MNSYQVPAFVRVIVIKGREKRESADNIGRKIALKTKFRIGKVRMKSRWCERSAGMYIGQNGIRFNLKHEEVTQD